MRARNTTCREASVCMFVFVLFLTRSVGEAPYTSTAASMLQEGLAQTELCPKVGGGIRVWDYRQFAALRSLCSLTGSTVCDEL